MLSRSTLLWSHRTVGLGLGLLLMLQAASGAALVFREDLLVVLNRQILAAAQPAAPPALDRILQAVDDRFGNPAVERVVFPRAARTAAMVYLEGPGLAGRRVIASDPASGAVLGELTGVGLAPFVLFRIHDELLLGNLGHALLLIEGAGLLFLVVAGVYLARPRWGTALHVRWRGTKLQRRFSLHRSLGLSFAVFLAFSAVTGAIMQADFLAAAAPLVRARPPGVDWSLLTPVVLEISRDYPAEAIEDVRISPDGRSAQILIYATDVIRPLALDRVEVDLLTGRAAPMQRAREATTGRGFLGWMYPLHSGKALGAIGAAIAILTALGLLCMPVLGFLLWRARPAAGPLHARASSVRNS